MQCKDIPDQPIIDFLQKVGRGILYGGFENSVLNAMPKGVNEKLAKAKMASLIKRRLVDGCACGCRGDFKLKER